MTKIKICDIVITERRKKGANKMTREAKRALLENRIKTLEERGKATPNLLASLKRELRGII